jgi:hypothetical protein
MFFNIVSYFAKKMLRRSKRQCVRPVEECAICATEFDLKEHKCVQCVTCSEKVCHECVATFLTMRNENAQCMCCKTEWDLPQLHKYMSKKWCDTVFAPFVKQCLLKKEVAKVSELWYHIAHYKSFKEWNRLVSIYNGLEDAHIQFQNFVRQHAIKIIGKTLSTGEQQQYDELCERSAQYYDALGQLEGHPIQRKYCFSATPHEWKLSYVEEDIQSMPTTLCYSEGCNGILHQNNVCSACSRQFCRECHGEKLQDHVCDASDVESVSLIEHECTQCPTCSASIFRTYGCDDMWCTQCHTSFYWDTGEVSEARENPHRSEWVRSGRPSPRVLVQPTTDSDYEYMQDFFDDAIRNNSSNQKYLIWLRSATRLVYLRGNRKISLASKAGQRLMLKRRIKYFCAEIAQSQFVDYLYYFHQFTCIIQIQKDVVQQLVTLVTKLAVETQSYNEDTAKKLLLQNVKKWNARLKKIYHLYQLEKRYCRYLVWNDRRFCFKKL